MIEQKARNLSSFKIGMKIIFMNMTKYTKYKGTRKAIRNKIRNFLSLSVFKTLGFSLALGETGLTNLLLDSYFF